MAIDSDDPVDLIRDLIGHIRQNASDLSDLRPPGWRQRCRGAFEQDFGREDEPVTDNLDAFAVTQNLPERAEELGTVIGKVCDFFIQARRFNAQAFGFGGFKFGAFLFGSGTGQRLIKLRTQCFDPDL